MNDIFYIELAVFICFLAFGAITFHMGDSTGFLRGYKKAVEDYDQYRKWFHENRNRTDDTLEKMKGKL